MSRVSVPIRARLWWEIFLLALRAEKIVRPKGDKKSQQSKPISLCISWDSLDLSSAASRRYYVPRFRAYACSSVVGISPTEGHLNIRES